MDLKNKKRELEEKIKLVDIFLKYSLPCGKETKAFGVASKLEAQGVSQYSEYIKFLKRKDIIMKIETLKNVENPKEVISRIFQAGLSGSKNMRVYTYRKAKLLSLQKIWRDELKKISLLPHDIPRIPPPRKRSFPWRPETIERVLEFLKKLINHDVTYVYGLEVVRSHCSSNACEFLKSKNLLTLMGSVKRVRLDTPEVFEQSKKGYAVITGMSPYRIPVNAKVWKLDLPNLRANFKKYVAEIRSKE